MGMIFTGGPDGAVGGAGALLPQAVLRMINVTPPTTAPACNVEPRIYCGTVTLRLMSPLSTSRVNQALPSLPIGTVREPTGSTTLSCWTAQGAPTSPRNQLRLTRCADCTFHWTVMSCPTTGPSAARGVRAPPFPRRSPHPPACTTFGSAVSQQTDGSRLRPRCLPSDS